MRDQIAKSRLSCSRIIVTIGMWLHPKRVEDQGPSVVNRRNRQHNVNRMRRNADTQATDTQTCDGGEHFRLEFVTISQVRGLNGDMG